MLCCCEDVSAEVPPGIVSGGWGTPWLTDSAVTDSVWVTFSWGIPQHKGGTNIPPPPRWHKKLPLLRISAFSGGETVSWWCLTRCCWFSVLSETWEVNKDETSMLMGEPCCPSSQVQPFLHKYKSLCCGARLRSYLKCKALQREVKECLEKLFYKEDNNMRRNASLIIKHMSLVDRQRDR